MNGVVKGASGKVQAFILDKVVQVATDANNVKTQKILDAIYNVAGANSGALKAGIVQGLNLTKDGHDFGCEMGTITQETMNDASYTAGYTGMSCKGTLGFDDVMDPLKIIDIFNVPAGMITDVAAATGKIGVKMVFPGTAPLPKLFSIVLRVPSKTVLGAFDHIVIPEGTLAFKDGLKFAKDKCLEGAVTFSGNATELVDSVNGVYGTHAWVFATAAAAL